MLNSLFECFIKKKKPREMDSKELKGNRSRRKRSQHTRIEVEYHLKYATPSMCGILG